MEKEVFRFNKKMQWHDVVLNNLYDLHLRINPVDGGYGYHKLVKSKKFLGITYGQEYEWVKQGDKFFIEVDPELIDDYMLVLYISNNNLLKLNEVDVRKHKFLYLMYHAERFSATYSFKNLEWTLLPVGCEFTKLDEDEKEMLQEFAETIIAAIKECYGEKDVIL